MEIAPLHKKRAVDEGEAERTEIQAVSSEKDTKKLKLELERVQAGYTASIVKADALKTVMTAAGKSVVIWKELRDRYESDRHNAFILARQAERRENEARNAWERYKDLSEELQISSAVATFELDSEKRSVEELTRHYHVQEMISSEARKIANRSISEGGR